MNYRVVGFSLTQKIVQQAEVSAVYRVRDTDLSIIEDSSLEALPSPLTNPPSISPKGPISLTGPVHTCPSNSQYLGSYFPS